MWMALALAAAVQVEPPRPDPPWPEPLAFTPSAATCAAWLGAPQSWSEGNGWVLGYWSGRNAASERRIDVGAGAGAQTIVARVRNACSARPTDPVLDVTAATYEAMAAQERTPISLRPPAR